MARAERDDIRHGSGPSPPQVGGALPLGSVRSHHGGLARPAARRRRPGRRPGVHTGPPGRDLGARSWSGADTGLSQRPALSVLSLLISLPMAFRRVAPWPAGPGLAGGRGRARADGDAPRGPGEPRGDAGGHVLARRGSPTARSATPGSFRCWPAPPRSARTSPTSPSWASCSARRGLPGPWSAAAVTTSGFRSGKRLDAAEEGAEAERHRIASELHDVVAHRVSMIVVQSQAADALLDTDPTAARGAVRAVEDAARQALAELRQVVGVLKEETGAKPQAVDLDRARQGRPGRPLGRRDSHAPAWQVSRGSVAPAVALAVFRIVQESLTNAARHAAGASVERHPDLRPGHRRGGGGGRRTGHRPASPGARTRPGWPSAPSFVGGTFDAGPATRAAASSCASRSRHPRSRHDRRPHRRRPGDGAVTGSPRSSASRRTSGSSASAADGVEAIEAAVRLAPDVVVMDVRMPRMDGIDATRQVVARTSARVLILTTFDLDEYVYRAVTSGASGFLLKDAPRGRLAEAIRQVHRGDMLVDQVVTRRLVERFARAGPRRRPETRPAHRPGAGGPPRARAWAGATSRSGPRSSSARRR